MIKLVRCGIHRMSPPLSRSEDSRYDLGPSLGALFSSLDILGEVYFPCRCDDTVVVCCPKVREKGGGSPNNDSKKAQWFTSSFSGSCCTSVGYISLRLLRKENKNTVV